VFLCQTRDEPGSTFPISRTPFIIVIIIINTIMDKRLETNPGWELPAHFSTHHSRFNSHSPITSIAQTCVNRQPYCTPVILTSSQKNGQENKLNACWAIIWTTGSLKINRKSSTSHHRLEFQSKLENMNDWNNMIIIIRCYPHTTFRHLHKPIEKSNGFWNKSWFISEIMLKGVGCEAKKWKVRFCVLYFYTHASFEQSVEDKLK